MGESRMYELNEDGRTMCLMVATMAAGYMANPANQGSIVNGAQLYSMAMEIMGAVLGNEDLRRVP